MKHHQLRYLACLASEGSIRAAARELGVSAAAVTQALKELEVSTQLQLFARQGKGVMLSAAGAQLLPYAQRMTALMQETQETAARLRDSEASEKLSVGVTPWVAQSLLAQLVPAFRQAMPHVQLELFDGLSGLAFPRLREGSLDLLIGRIAEGQAMHGLESTPMFSYEMTVIARAGHPDSGAHSLAQLLHNDWVLNFTPAERSSYLANLFGQHGVTPPLRNIQLAHSPALMMTLVEQTDMLSFCPWPLVEAMDLRGKIVALQLKESFQTNVVGIVRRAQESASPAARVFMALLGSTVQQWQQTRSPRLRRVLHSVDIVAGGLPLEPELDVELD